MPGAVSSAAERARVRAHYETPCASCGGPCWGRGVPGRRCKVCVRLNAKRVTVAIVGGKRRTKRTDAAREGLRYQWGAP